MKDLGEILSLTNGAAVKGVTNGAASLSRSSSSSSVDLHLTDDSEEDADGHRNDSESVHDPKTSKLAATGANFINVHNDSPKQHLEIVKSFYKELDNSIVESTACSKPNSVKTDDKCKRLGLNCGTKGASECVKDVETGLQSTSVHVKETADSLPVTENSTMTLRNQCNNSSSEATSLTNGNVKTVLIRVSPMTVIAEPCKILTAEKESNHIAAKTSVKLNINVERTILINDGCQAMSECTSMPSEGGWKNKEEVERKALEKELEEDSNEKDEELKEDSKDDEEAQRIALDNEMEQDSKDDEEAQRIALDKEIEQVSKDNEEMQRIALETETEENSKDKEEEAQRISLDNGTEQDSKDNAEVQRIALEKDIEEDSKDNEEVQRIALEKDIEEDSKDNEEVQRIALDKEIEQVSKDNEEVQRIALKTEIEEDSKDNEEVQRIALENEMEQDFKDKNQVQRIALEKEIEDSKDNEEVQTTAVHKEIKLDSKDNEDVQRIALDKEIEHYKSGGTGSHAPLEESKHSVPPTSAHSGVSKNEDLTPSLEICVVDTEDNTSKPSKLSENVHEPQCSNEVETESSVATSNCSLKTEQLTSKVEKTDRSAIVNEASSAKDDAVVPHVPEVNESQSSAKDKSCAGESGDNDKNAVATTNNTVDQLKITSKSTIINFSDSADEPGEVNVCPDGSQSDLIIDLDEDTGEAGATNKQDKSTGDVGCKHTETLVKADADCTFDMLLKHEINKTLESVCTQEVRKAQQSQADVSPADIRGSRDDSSGFSVHAHKRVSSIEDPVESKKAKLTNGHGTEQDVDSIDLTGEKTCTKRALEISDTLQSKKARVLVLDESSSNSRASTMLSEQVPKKPEPEIALDESSTVPAVPRKSLSNIDKAIERVAFAGLDRKERIMMPFIKDLKNRRLQDITIDDLEELVTQRMGEVLSETGENGVLREKVQKLEKMTEFWKHKATSLQKQLSDMTMVFKKLATETKQNSNQMQIPIKITRSVGLQVIMPSLQSVGKSNTTHVRNGLPPGTKRKSGGIMTNRNTTPTHHYPASTALSPNRTPVVQKVVTPTTIKLPQAVPAPKPPMVAPPPTIRYRAPTTVVTSVVSTGTVMTVAGNLRTAASITNRPVVKSVTPRPTSDMLIDLTDEDDKTKRVSSNSLTQPLRVAQLNGSPPSLGSTIRFGPPQQLTGIATGVNGQRLTYMLPASAGNAASGRLQLFTQQTSGNLRPSGLLTVRPSTQTGTLMLKNGAVVSSATSAGNIMRAATTGTFQQVVARPGQMRSIQPANRLTESSASRPIISLPPLHPQHPAPLPPPPPEFPSNPSWKKPPPRPDLKISKVDNREQHGIILSWNMDHGTEHEEIASYQLYAYQENNSPPSTSQWKKVGDVKAMPLPMACTLTQFLEGNKYHFAVRAIDIHSRSGLFSIPGHIILPRRGS